MGLVGDAVQKGCGQIGIAEYFGPVAKAHVAGDDHRLSFMALGEHLEKKLGPLCGKGNVSEFIDDQQTIAGIALDHPLQPFVVTGLDQLIGQRAAGDKARSDPVGAGLHAKGGGKVGFAGSAFAQKDHVAGAADILAGAKLFDQAHIQLRGRFELEALQGF